MVALVTGQAGFTGSHLVGEQLKRWYKPIVLDEVSTARLGKEIKLPIQPSWHSDHALFSHHEPFTSCLVILGSLCHSQRA